MEGRVTEKKKKKPEPQTGEKGRKCEVLGKEKFFHFRSPTTYFHCKVLSKKRGSSDSTAEGQPVISLPHTTDTGETPESTELERYIVQ